jgi:hypothetical protein
MKLLLSYISARYQKTADMIMQIKAAGLFGKKALSDSYFSDDDSILNQR